jgi:hypothetical protein
MKNQLTPSEKLQTYLDRDSCKMGFFALMSIHLFQIVEDLNRSGTAKNIDFKNFRIHNNMNGNKIRDIFFEKNDQLVIKYKNILYEVMSNQYFYAAQDGNMYKEIINKYFEPKFEIKVLKKYYKSELGIQVNNTISVYYRGTDTAVDRAPNYYNVFIKNLKKIINKNNQINQIFLQTDDAMFSDFIKTSNLDAKIIENRFLPPVYSHRGQHFLNKEDKILQAQKMLASILLMSECRYVLCNNSNISRWVHFYRDLNDGYYQMQGNGIYPDI